MSEVCVRSSRHAKTSTQCRQKLSKPHKIHFRLAPVQIFHIYQEDPFEEIPQEKYLQYWISASLLGATKLTSLSMRADSLPWTPVLGLLSIRQLELTMKWVMPWLDVIVDDLTFCSCLETLKITESMEGEWECISMRLPDLCFHHVATLKSVELLGWYPKGKFTLHLGCLLRLGVALQTHTQWKQCQAKCQPLSMLCLKCVKLRAWPAGIGETSGLQYLALECRKMQDQDLAALQHIPCVFLAFEKYSSLLLARGSWQRLALCGCAGFTMSFARVDEFVRGTKRFLFDSTVQEAGEMFGVLRAACMRQGSAYYMCEPTDEYAENPKRALFSNVQLCRAPQDDTAYDKYHQVHEKFIRMDGFWPC